jgi:hypothetical protein
LDAAKSFLRGSVAEAKLANLTETSLVAKIAKAMKRTRARSGVKGVFSLLAWATIDNISEGTESEPPLAISGGVYRSLRHRKNDYSLRTPAIATRRRMMKTRYRPQQSCQLIRAITRTKNTEQWAAEISAAQGRDSMGHRRYYRPSFRERQRRIDRTARKQ